MRHSVPISNPMEQCCFTEHLAFVTRFYNFSELISLSCILQRVSPQVLETSKFLGILE
ncbi:Uncharacterized protein TCM_022471 [Theobroma cacao]|uniref:Uncharacterized protein n=1 Tax=Theobroma cacao TaxID=3641 RepID=A0A061F0V5_THECC|nr:Uncharacterized protein TCM_022471 [Theobroma cacao]